MTDVMLSTLPNLRMNLGGKQTTGIVKMVEWYLKHGFLNV